ncbi:MAG: hypothetical protein AAF993_16915 [Pseudomonadota bacterium]
MKIRISDDSIRLRLDRSEVAQIEAGSAVECVTHFSAGNQFRYCLNVAAAGEVSAEFIEGCITVTLPAEVASRWAGTESEVSIRAQQALPAGDLHLLIEKDFECLDPREGEDQSNRFRNPKALA